MPRPKTGEEAILLRFGGGVNSRASEADINEQECALGYNFDLDVANRELRPRPPARYLGLCPNEEPVRGFATFRDLDGNVTLLVQAGGNVYKWNSYNSFTLVGTCNANARLRGRLEHISPVDEVVLITDLELLEPVKQWDGTTLSDITFSDETAAGFGEFRARYCAIENERAIFANVWATTATPNLIVGSKRGDYTTISVANRPSSSLGDEDPFFLVQPDNGSINGMAKAYGLLAFSSRNGDIYRLTGETAKDFQMTGLFPRSGVQGDEALVAVGSDIHFGRQGRIQGLVSTSNYGDVEAEDISLPISDQTEDVAEWTGAYNSRLQRAYWFPDDQINPYVFHSAFKPPPRPSTESLQDILSGKGKAVSDLSPWAPWKFDVAGNFTWTAIMPVLMPDDGLEYVIAGTEDGDLVLFEGIFDGNGDFGTPGTQEVTVSRLSKRYQLNSDASAFNLQGWITYRKGDAFTVTLTIEASGESIFDETITISIPATTEGSYYGGAVYYGGSFYHGTPFSHRVARRKFAVAGKPQEFQIRVAVTEVDSWRIEEIGLRFDAAS